MLWQTLLGALPIGSAVLVAIAVLGVVDFVAGFARDSRRSLSDRLYAIYAGCLIGSFVVLLVVYVSIADGDPMKSAATDAILIAMGSYTLGAVLGLVCGIWRRLRR
jgi:uncharacterized membrane protein